MPGKKSTSPIKLSSKVTIRISEAAKLLGVTTMTLRRWEKANYIEPLRIGPRKDRRYKKEQILKLLEERKSRK